MSKYQGNVLIIDDNKEINIALKFLLSDYFEVDTIQNPNYIHQTLINKKYDVFVLDMNFTTGNQSGNEGIFWMNKILEIDPLASIVLITAYGEIELSVKAIKKGAFDFIQKPWDDEKLIATIIAAYKYRKSQVKGKLSHERQKQFSSELDKNYQQIIANSDNMLHLLDMLDKVAKTDANILILGENGTGKELIAREIHRKSTRKNEVFLGVDVGSIAENLFESELFGHEKGAFTDAKESRTGRFELASKGTLFLDEIGNIGLNLQAKLLSAIQNKTIQKVGSEFSIPIDIRLVSATNKSLMQMVTEGTFRQDLLYRINTIQLEIPPLRERKIDIPILANYFLNKNAEKYSKGNLKLSNNVLKKLKEYHWPGNIRELEHTMEKAAILADIDNIQDISFINSSIQNTHSKNSLNLEENEKFLISKALEKNHSHLSETAKELGISRKTLYNKMKKYDIQ
jgi:DNA-binding NtrC family response regulator